MHYRPTYIYVHEKTQPDPKAKSIFVLLLHYICHTYHFDIDFPRKAGNVFGFYTLMILLSDKV